MSEETPLERWSRQMGEHRHIDPQSAMYTQVELERIIKLKNQVMSVKDQQIASLRAELARVTEERDKAIAEIGEQGRLRGLVEAKKDRLRDLLKRWKRIMQDEIQYGHLCKSPPWMLTDWNNKMIAEIDAAIAEAEGDQ